MTAQSNGNAQLRSIEDMVAKTCFCKLREYCEDKDSVACMRHRNIVAEFMAEKHPKTIK